MNLINHLRTFLRLPTDLEIRPEVRENFRRNFINNTLDSSFWLLGESFVSVNAILPVFASTLTESAILIGLVPALINAGWFIPQLFMVGYVKRLTRKLPFARAMGVVERVPFLIMPLTAFLLNWISGSAAIWIFMLVVAWRGFASGMVALPWQEVIASVIPSPVRSRFFGVSRMIGRIFGVGGSLLAGIVLAEVSYPNNYALSFLIGAGFVWLSFFFFSRTVEPNPPEEAQQTQNNQPKAPLIDLPAFKEILIKDVNFRTYLISRIFFQLGNMAAGFFAVFGIRQFTLPDERAAVFSAMLFTSAMIGFLLWGMVGDRIGPRNISLISDFLQVVVLIIAAFAPSLGAYYLVFLVFGFSQSGSIIGDLVMGMGLGPEEERPAYLGLVRSVPGIFVLIAPLAGGVLVEWLGFQAMFLIALSFGLIGIMLLFQVKSHGTL